MWPLEYLIKKPPVPMKWATVILMKVKSCNALLHMVLICIYSHLKSVLRYKFLILDNHHLDNIFMWARTWGSVVMLWSQKGYASKKVWETPLYSRPRKTGQLLWQDSVKVMRTQIHIALPFRCLLHYNTVALWMQSCIQMIATNH
jgi:hypothetical protein